MTQKFTTETVNAPVTFRAEKDSIVAVFQVGLFYLWGAIQFPRTSIIFCGRIQSEISGLALP